VATAVLAIRDGVIPPTVNLREPADASPLNFVVDQPRAAELKTVLIIARGFGGFNSAMVLRKVTV
jgi:act minimal PKS chain-length factor (CLF/KS beta)